MPSTGINDGFYRYKYLFLQKKKAKLESISYFYFKTKKDMETTYANLKTRIHADEFEGKKPINWGERVAFLLIFGSTLAFLSVGVFYVFSWIFNFASTLM